MSRSLHTARTSRAITKARREKATRRLYNDLGKSEYYKVQDGIEFYAVPSALTIERGIEESVQGLIDWAENNTVVFRFRSFERTFEGKYHYVRVSAEDIRIKFNVKNASNRLWIDPEHYVELSPTAQGLVEKITVRFGFVNYRTALKIKPELVEWRSRPHLARRWNRTAENEKASRILFRQREARRLDSYRRGERWSRRQKEYGRGFNWHDASWEESDD